MPWTLKNPAAADIAPDWLRPYYTQFLRKLSDQGYAAVTLRSYDGAAELLPVPLCAVAIYVLFGSRAPVGGPRVRF
jgi:hypothetical protein